jgi:hypothetical protein
LQEIRSAAIALALETAEFQRKIRLCHRCHRTLELTCQR